MKIAIAQFYTQNIDYAKYVTEVNRMYCERHGYEYIVENDTAKITTALEGRSPTWYKPKLISDILNTTDIDYVLFLDIDAVIVDHDDKIENYISAEHDLVFTEDYGAHSIMNAGVFIAKNTEWVKQTMLTWWDLGDSLRGDANPRLQVPVEWQDKPGYFRTALWHDQTCLTYLHDTDEEFKNKINVITYRRLNWREPFDNNFVYHGFAYGNVAYRRMNQVHSKLTGQLPATNEGKSLMELVALSVSDKEYVHSYYSRVYDKLLTPLQTTTKRVMEIGVLEGASLAIWRDYFINAEIVGIDNNSECGSLVRGLDRISLDIADTGNEEDLRRLQQKYIDVDIILDDGGHKMHEQQLAFAYLFQSLKPNGLYILEDLHTSTEARMPEKYVFNWGDPTKTTTLEMLRNYQTTGKIVSDYLTPEQCAYLENNIDTVTIFDDRGEYTSITSVITKKTPQPLVDRLWTSITSLFRR